MRVAFFLFGITLAFAREPDVRREHWGMTQNEVIKAEKASPLKRTDHSLVYRDKESGIPAQVLFEFTGGTLDAVSYVAESSSPEVAFLTWCLEVTKRFGQGVVYLNKKPVGPVRAALNDSMKRLKAQKNGELVVVFSPEGPTYAGVGITFTNGEAIVDMDYADTPKEKQSL